MGLGLGIGTIAGMGILSVVSALAEKVLEYKGKDDIANTVGVVTKGTLITTTVVTVVVTAIKGFKDLNSLM